AQDERLKELVCPRLRAARVVPGILPALIRHRIDGLLFGHANLPHHHTRRIARVGEIVSTRGEHSHGRLISARIPSSCVTRSRANRLASPTSTVHTPFASMRAETQVITHQRPRDAGAGGLASAFLHRPQVTGAGLNSASEL